MALPINDLSSFSPQNEFLKGAFDAAGDFSTRQLTDDTVPDSEKESQRKQYIQLVSNLACLKGHGILNTILGELEAAKTNRDFLDAMKRVEPLIRRVRKRLSEVQILEWSDDAFAPLEFRRETTVKSVSALEKLTGASTVASSAAVFFVSHILPILSEKRKELERGAHHVGEPVFRDDMEFPGNFYGVGSTPKSSETSLERRIWNGVQLPNRSEYGPKLLKLSMEPQYQNRLITFEELARLLSDDSIPLNMGALKQGIIKVDNLFKHADRSTPYEKRHGQGIYFNSSAQQTVLVSVAETGNFIPNADFLEQSLTFSEISLAQSGQVEELIIENIPALGLSEDAQKVLRFLLGKNEGDIQIISEMVAELGGDIQITVRIDSIVAEINQKIQKTGKKVTKAGKRISIGSAE